MEKHGNCNCDLCIPFTALAVILISTQLCCGISVTVLYCRHLVNFYQPLLLSVYFNMSHCIPLLNVDSPLPGLQMLQQVIDSLGEVSLAGRTLTFPFDVNSWQDPGVYSFIGPATPNLSV